MIKEKTIYKIYYVKSVEPLFVAATSFRSAAAIAVSITDEEIRSIVKQDIVVSIKFD